MAELQIFKELQRVCDLHGLRYFLIGGSLIGAVRHSGFIPWDDDVDVGMPRPDYDRFSDLCQSELNERFFWQTYRTEPNHNAIFGKLRMNDTTYVETATAHLPMHHGIKIDVFPFDGVPRSARGKSLHRLSIKLCMMKIGAKTKRPAPTIQERAATLLPRRAAIALLERMAGRFPFDESDFVVNAGGAWGYARESVPRAWLSEVELVKFEDTLAPVPKHWHEYLTQIYGDYMQLPPEEERRSDRHPAASIDFGAGDEP